jgi:5-formyltetrahydrofolate cyclo-ligase
MDKRELRAMLRQARSSRVANPQDAAVFAAHGLAAVGEVEAATVACYVADPVEPPTALLRADLRASGVRVLLPRVSGTDLIWVVDRGDEHLEVGAYGLLEPQGDAVALADADLVLAPAAAVDRRGGRLGRGAGFYDRALGHRRAGVAVLALVFDEEILPEVPTEAHDVAIDGALTQRDVYWWGT